MLNEKYESIIEEMEARYEKVKCGYCGIEYLHNPDEQNYPQCPKCESV